MGQNQILGGNGNVVNVNSRKQLLTHAIAVSPIHEASFLGNAYSWTAISADIVAGETGLLVQNIATSKILVIDRMYLWTDTAAQLKIHCPVTATFAGTGVVGNNLNRRFSNNAPANAFADETANAFVAGNVIETVYSPLAVNAQITTAFAVQIDFKGAVILGANDSIAVDIVTETAAYEITIVGYFQSLLDTE